MRVLLAAARRHADWKGRDGAFVTSVPNDHNRKYHKDGAGNVSQERVDESAKTKTKAMLFVGNDLAEGAPPPPGMSSYYVPSREKALASAARTYIYGKGFLSKATFDDEELRGMLQAYWDGGNPRGKAPVLTTKGLKVLVDAECAVCCFFAPPHTTPGNLNSK